MSPPRVPEIACHLLLCIVKFAGASIIHKRQAPPVICLWTLFIAMRAAYYHGVVWLLPCVCAQYSFMHSFLQQTLIEHFIGIRDYYDIGSTSLGIESFPTTQFRVNDRVTESRRALSQKSWVCTLALAPASCEGVYLWRSLVFSCVKRGKQYLCSSGVVWIEWYNFQSIIEWSIREGRRRAC